jgi:hypothetical protein
MSVSDSKPTQVLLGPADRERSRRLQRRLLDLDIDAPGPTALFRAGLLSLSEADDQTLVRIIESTPSRSAPSSIASRFEQWCAIVADRVAERSTDLRGAYNRTRGSQPGSFSHAGRLIVLSLSRGGRVQISGIAQPLDPLEPGERAKESREMFPGEPAIVSMTDEGQEFAVRAIVAWLTNDELTVNKIRADIPAPNRTTAQ